jgi:dTMP kinase
MKRTFITFEGGEGCGKSTHSKLLKKYLQSKGNKVVLTLEPGATKLGKTLRQILLKGIKLRAKLTELFLFAADRMEHVETVIKPALKKGCVVICDRFIDSTTAYQSMGRKIDPDLVKIINHISSGGLMPDITILLDIKPTVGIKRGTIHSGKDKFESENGLFHDRVRKGYLKIAKNDPKRVILIDTSGSIKEVQDKIRRVVDEKL